MKADFKKKIVFAQMSMLLGAAIFATFSHDKGAESADRSPAAALAFDAIEVTGEDKVCRSTPYTLRQFFYDSLKRAAPKMTESQKSVAVARYSKLISMAVKESSGNSANVTDMKARGSAASDQRFFAENRGLSMGSPLQTTLNLRDQLMGLSNVTVDKQTNYGILQMSADRLTSKTNRAIYDKYQR